MRVQLYPVGPQQPLGLAYYRGLGGFGDSLGDRIMTASEGPGGQDYKTRLQELVARHFPEPPRYSIRDEGPDHAKQFFAEVRVGGDVRGSGEGRSKKQAEAAAARAAWEGLRLELEAASESKAAGIA